MAPVSPAIPQNLEETIGTANMVGVVLSTVTYGVNFTLFAYIIRLYYGRVPYVTRSRVLQHRNWRYMAYTTVLFGLATVGLCLQSWLNHKAFILHRRYHGGPLAYMVDNSHDAGNIAVTMIYVVLNWFTDGMLLYRFAVIFGSTWKARVLALTMLISLVVLGSFVLTYTCTLSVGLWTDTSTTLSLSYLVVSLAINVIITTSIVGKLLFMKLQSSNIRWGTQSSLYDSVIALVVESASLYTVVGFICVVAVGVNSPLQNALLPMLGQLQAMPTFLINIRVMEDRAVDPHNTLQSTIDFVWPSREGSLDGEYKPPAFPETSLSRTSTFRYGESAKAIGSTSTMVDDTGNTAPPKYTNSLLSTCLGSSVSLLSPLKSEYPFGCPQDIQPPTPYRQIT